MAGNSIYFNFLSVIEIPSTSYLDSLLACTDFHPYQIGRKEEGQRIPEVIIHFTSPEVMNDPRYQQWVNAFSPSVFHLLLNENSTCFNFQKSSIVQFQLNHLLPNVFPLLHKPQLSFVKDKVVEKSEAPPLTNQYGFSGPTIQGNSLISYELRPLPKFEV